MFGPKEGPGGKLPMQLPICPEADDGLGQFVGVIWRHDQPGVTDHLSAAAAPAADDRAPVPHGFHIGHAERFVEGGGDKKIAAAIKRIQLLLGDHAEKANLVDQRAMAAAELLLRPLGRLADAPCEDEPTFGLGGQHLRNRGQQAVSAFPGFKPPDIKHHSIQPRLGLLAPRGRRGGHSMRNDQNPVRIDGKKGADFVPMGQRVGAQMACGADQGILQPDRKDIGDGPFPGITLEFRNLGADGAETNQDGRLPSPTQVAVKPRVTLGGSGFNDIQPRGLPADVPAETNLRDEAGDGRTTPYFPAAGQHPAGQFGDGKAILLSAESALPARAVAIDVKDRHLVAPRSQRRSEPPVVLGNATTRTRVPPTRRDQADSHRLNPFHAATSKTGSRRPASARR